ncbi:type II restriction endonuclease [Plantactinospora siamensis]|uniref:Type II restriction endonuclease n=1 Tax=Plantactinospora siamensis TaxID=555372 RepID=A0ABV6NQ93_9ACTN
MQPIQQDPLRWLRSVCSYYRFEAGGVYQAAAPNPNWPLQAHSPAELTKALTSRGHLLPLPKEPAALANVIEVSISGFIAAAAAREKDSVVVRRGSERGYPDLEISGNLFGGAVYAVDVKVARRAQGKRGTVLPRTQSRITLYTGNTYFKWPKLHWPGTFRPFDDYTGHLDVVVLYTFDEMLHERVTDLEILVHEPWRIASKKRSSKTREYIGAVNSIEGLREGRGEFDNAAEFYRYWRAFPFETSASVSNILQRLVQQQTSELDRLRSVVDN